MSAALLSVRDLNVRIPTPTGTLHAVRGVSFDVQPGEVLGLVGESGSGKSVTLRALTGLHRPPITMTGDVVYGGENLLSAGEARLRRVRGGQIGMIFQEPMSALNPVLTVGEQIVENLRAHRGLRGGAAQDRAAQLLDLTGIPSPRARLSDYPHQFSGGMRQRAMIAIALASEPKLLLADEPTTALDVTIQDQILRLLLQLREELHMGIILVTHDLGVVAQTCDRVAVMYGGRLMETAPVRDLFAQPRHAYTLGLLRSLPGAEAQRTPLVPIPGGPPNLRHLPQGCAFAPRCTYATDACVGAEPPLVDIAPERTSACVHAAELPSTRERVEVSA
ncbi:peptide/nickel transport system ATP-binding protein/oligopeptide transport system ATP-binding protein [Deinococcus metalli]|uniref:ABC transporter ATP-binding protein n=1 Tax=Deinococcus metalli TaxID=1141878 RepID=A0A7W8KEH4_9DEIO|nr:ABC transporter ATP-binding protein [Deinococcus metalli]MBB5375623.1 peptide/nickel transport system ATP-binding protein/oligopeptide transport system ATP-binding protein [Deinococcus metalli]GHF38300.1 ABC transporter ATP-binding protein [Deinococcus metalli]